MGFILAIIIVFNFKSIWNSKLVRGELNLKTTFWGFGVLGSSIILGICITYILNKLGTDETLGGFYLKGAIKASAVLAGSYAFFIFIAIWKSAASATTLYKFLARYLSLFLLSTALGCLMISWLNVAVGLASLYLIKKYKKPGSEVAIPFK